jgi:glycosyltransferase involved in cell wall biosynthesis
VDDWVPLISVFMKSYNHDRFISEAIESVIGQSFEDLELIIVDDGSTDSSRQIIDSYEQQDSRIRSILHERNLGITKVVNDGINASQGKYIAQIDSDDVWVEDKLQKQLAVFDGNENLIVWSEGELIDHNGKLLGETFSESVRSVAKKKSGNIFQQLLARNYIFGSTLLYKKANLSGLRYDEGLLYNNDYKFLLELARKCSFCYCAEPLARYRIHSENTLAGSRLYRRLWDKEYRGFLSAEVTKRRRRAYQEEVMIRQEALHGYYGKIPDMLMADICASSGFCYRKLGEHNKAIRFYWHAIRYNPRSWSNLAYSASIFALALRNLLSART